MSALPTKPYSSVIKGERAAQSAGNRPRKSMASLFSVCLPQHTLRAAIESILSSVQCDTDDERQSSKLVDLLKRVSELFPMATEKSEWSLVSFCYECGRSVGVVLVNCPGCRSIKYCSKSCRAESWKRGHQLECTGAQVAKGTSRRNKCNSRV